MTRSESCSARVVGCQSSTACGAASSAAARAAARRLVRPAPTLSRPLHAACTAVDPLVEEAALTVGDRPLRSLRKVVASSTNTPHAQIRGGGNDGAAALTAA